METNFSNFYNKFSLEERRWNAKFNELLKEINKFSSNKEINSFEFKVYALLVSFKRNAYNNLTVTKKEKLLKPLYELCSNYENRTDVIHFTHHINECLSILSIINNHRKTFSNHFMLEFKSLDTRLQTLKKIINFIERNS